MKFLLDTNVIAEIRKGSRANANVRSWFAALDPETILLSVVTVGKIRRGIENVRRRDPAAARALERWLQRAQIEREPACQGPAPSLKPPVDDSRFTEIGSAPAVLAVSRPTAMSAVPVVS